MALKLSKDLVVITLGRIIQAVIALASIRLMTTFLSKEQVGYQYLITAIFGYFSLVFINPIGMYFNRQIHSLHRSGQLFGFLKALNTYFLLVSSLTLLMLIIVILKFHPDYGVESWQFILLVMLNTFFGTWFYTLCPSLNMLEKRMPFVAITLITQLLGLGLSIFFVLYLKNSAFWWLLGTLVSQIFGTIISFYQFRKIIKDEPFQKLEISKILNRSVFHFCWPIAITTFFMWLQTQSYRLVVESKVGAEDLAHIAIGIGIATSFFGLGESIVSQYLMPRFYSAISSGHKKLRADAWNQQFEASFICYLTILALVLITAKPLLLILVDHKFSNVVEVVRLGALIEFFRVLTNSIGSIAHSELQTRKSILPYAVGGTTVILILLMGGETLFRNPLYMVPATLALGGLACLGIMWKKMKSLLEIITPVRLLLKSLIVILPMFGIVYFADNTESILGALLTLSITGLLLLVIMIYLLNTLMNSTSK